MLFVQCSFLVVFGHRQSTKTTFNASERKAQRMSVVVADFPSLQRTAPSISIQSPYMKANNTHTHTHAISIPLRPFSICFHPNYGRSCLLLFVRQPQQRWTINDSSDLLPTKDVDTCFCVGADGIPSLTSPFNRSDYLSVRVVFAAAYYIHTAQHISQQIGCRIP